MTNIFQPSADSLFLDQLDVLAAFDTWTSTDGSEGLTFNLLVTPEEFWMVQEAARPFAFDERVTLSIEFRSPDEGREYGRIEIEGRGKRSGLVELGRALVDVYDRINSQG